MDIKAKQRKNPINDTLTAVAAASIVGIMLMMPLLYSGAATGQSINAYGQLTPPFQIQQGGE